MSLRVKITTSTFILVFILFACPWNVAFAQYQGCAYISQIPRDECEALERFFEQTNGPFWQNNRGWLVSNQPCNWFGLTCTSSSWPRNVVSIKFSVNDISGSLPGEIAQLPELRELIIENSQAGVDGDFTQLGGGIPTVIGDLKKLEVLWLSNNKIDQSLAIEIGQLESLRILRLDNNLLTGPLPATIGDLSQLEEINLSDNQLAGRIPDNFSKLSRLSSLQLAENILTGTIPPSLGNLSSLRKLDLSDNLFTGIIPASLTSLKRLNSLKLQGNPLEGALNYFQASQLRGLAECELPIEDASTLCLPSFDDNDENFCGLEVDPSCGLCGNIDAISKQECYALEAIYGSTKSANWTSSSTWFEDASPCSWDGISCLNGEVVGVILPENNLSGSLPADLSLMTSLRALDLSGNSISGPLPDQIGGLEKLELIDLRGNDFSGVVPLAIAELAGRSSTCHLENNGESLCVPVNPDYQEFGQDICGIEPSLSCEPAIFTNIETFQFSQDATRLVLEWTVDDVGSDLDFRVQQLRQNDFTDIGVVSSIEDIEAYQHIVTQPQKGISVFRIQMTSPSGTLKNGPELEALFVPNQILINGPFPNPGIGHTNISFAIEEGGSVELNLYDAMGRLQRNLFKDDVNPAVLETIFISLEGLVAGPYFIQFQTPERTLVRPLVIL